jgi:predicted NAD/FAD-dependent oxidoreductase
LETGETVEAATLLLTPPVPQSLALLEQGGVELEAADRALLEQARYWKCLTILVRVEGTTQAGENGFAEPKDGVLAWVGDNYAKGVSPVPGCLTLHGTKEFSEAHWDEPQAVAVHAMLEAAEPYFQGRIRSYYLHRWRYAEPAMQMPELFHGIGGLAFAGDVFGGPRVGGAVCSGLSAADYLMAR